MSFSVVQQQNISHDI